MSRIDIRKPFVTLLGNEEDLEKTKAALAELQSEENCIDSDKYIVFVSFP
jgi:hypothetical protein